MICEWCGHSHDVTALCSSRPKWSRRGFLALMGAAIAGAAVGSADPEVYVKGILRRGKVILPTRFMVEIEVTTFNDTNRKYAWREIAEVSSVDMRSLGTGDPIRIGDNGRGIIDRG